MTARNKPGREGNVGAEPYVRRTPRSQRIWGTLFGTPVPTFQAFLPRPSWKSRLLRWSLRKAARMVRRTFRRGWIWRRALAPWYVAMTIWVAAALASQMQRGWSTILGIAVVGAVPGWRWLGMPAWRFTRRRNLKPVGQRIWYAGFYAFLTLWASVAAAWTALPPWAGVLWVATMTVWVRWMWHHRTRFEIPAVMGDLLDDRTLRWNKVEGLAGTSLVDPVELEAPKRWEAKVDLSSTKLLVKDVVAALPHIAKVFERPVGNIIADYGPGRLEHVAHLTVVDDNPCNTVTEYDESWMPSEQDVAEGVVPYHLYPNGVRGKVRLWLPEAGCVNSLFTGDVRSGKSAGMEAKMLQATMTGKVWPMVGDPQGGVSMPTWCGPQGLARWQAPCKEGDLEPIWRQLNGLREGMYARSDAMSRFEWVDEYGDEQVGLNCWDPDLTGWCAVGYALDEAWRVLLIPEMAAILKELLKMMGKVGYYIDLATQYPGLEEFNNDMGMRQPLNAGNLLAYRNSAGSVKSMILPSHLPGPFEIPTETVAGEHTKGTLICSSQAPRSSLPVYSRSVWAKRGRFWAKQAIERVPRLDPYTADAFAKYGCEAALLDVSDGFIRETFEKIEQREREKVTVAEPKAAPVAAKSGKAKRQTALDRIKEFLSTRPDRRAHTGVIAEALEIPLGTVSTTLRRVEGREVHQDRRGIWALGVAANRQLAIDDEPAA